MGHSYNGEERRKELRLAKNYSLFFYYKDSPDGRKSDASFIKDIARGGVRFTTSQHLATGVDLIFEIGLPHIAPRKLILEGVVISVKEIMPRLVYEIRARFNTVDEETAQIFDRIEQQKSKGS